MDFRDIKEFLKDSLGFIIIIAIVLLANIYIVSFQQVVGPSMNSNLKSGDIVVLNKIIYKFRDIKRCDVVSFEIDSKNMVKRVIGLPGEHIEYKDNYLYIDGVKYTEDYLDEKMITNDFKLEDLPGNYEKIPEGMYLVLGDNRLDSMDSRDYGLVSKDIIRGKISIRIWPLSGIKLIR